MLSNIQNAGGFTVTLNTTEECNLRCKYCYEINKRNKVLKLEDAKKFVDIILSDPDPCDLLKDEDYQYRAAYVKGITWDFIGGDSLMNVDLLDDIFSYIYKKVYTEDLPNNKYYRGHMAFSVCSNGTLFSIPKVRDFCEKWSDILHVNVSIDGCPEIHDKYRVFKDGSGSMKTILEWWPWYQKTFPNDCLSTKATCSKASIPYLYESLKFMHETLGIRYVNQNFIMEDTGCTEEDYKELDKQLGLCIDYVLSHSEDLHWSMIDKQTFAFAHRSQGVNWEHKGHCGSGAMPALGINGKIYPCFRWLPHTQDETVDFSVGNIKDGLSCKENFKKVRFGSCRVNCTRDPKCKECDCESACSYCIAGCYNEFKDFIRTTYICEITKLQVKWARIYWDKYNELNGLPKYDYSKGYVDGC